MQNEIYKDFFKEFEEFFVKEKEYKQKNSSFNPLLAIRSSSDEVRLHSRMLQALLNTQGEHYQKDLFLRIFLQNLKIDEWFGDTTNAQVLKECKNIDIYITNGKKHIIIENKIRAGDAYNQLARYIETIHNPNFSANLSDENSSENINYENIAVIYLSPFGKVPSDDSLALKEKGIQWKVKGNTLEFGKESIEYRQISYKEHIMQWIEKCQKEVKAIPNLNSAFEFYKDIVKIITNQKEDIMSIKELLKQKREFIAIAAEVKKIEIEQMCVELFQQEVASKPEFSEWEIVDSGVAFGFCPKKYRHQRFKFMLTLEKTNCNRYLGFRLHINGKFENRDLPKRLKKIIEKQGFKLNSWGWWLVDENGKEMVDLTQESLEKYFDEHYKKVNALNDFLGEQEKQNGSEISKLASEVKD